MVADLYQGGDQPVGETQRNIPSEDDDRYGTIWLLSTMAMSLWKCIEEYLRVPPLQWITHYRTHTFLIWKL